MSIDRQLWQQVQRIVYPKRSPSSRPPFPRSAEMGPKRKPASWLYYQLHDDSHLRDQVFPGPVSQRSTADQEFDRSWIEWLGPNATIRTRTTHMSATLTKLRIQQERLKRSYEEASDAELKARREWERAWLAYLDQAELEGLCRYCLKPRSEGNHENCVGSL